MVSAQRNIRLEESIKELHDSETAREYLDDSDLQHSSLCV
jgi:hypothetical protein